MCITSKGRYMTSPQREKIKAVLEEANRPLPPRAVAEGAHFAPEATRKLLYKMRKAGEVIGLKGLYALPGYEAQEPCTPDQSQETGAPPPVDEAVDAQGDAVDGDELPPSKYGIWVYDARTGGSIPWRNKAIDGPYP
jgi:hypothetical protein